MGLLAGVAAGLVVVALQAGPPAAQAQGIPGGGQPQGVFAVAGPLSRDSYGLYLVDVPQGTLMVYEYDATRRHLGLRAARTFRFDRQLEAYNTEPQPSDIADMVRQARPIDGP